MENYNGIIQQNTPIQKTDGKEQRITKSINGEQSWTDYLIAQQNRTEPNQNRQKKPSFEQDSYAYNKSDALKFSDDATLITQYL